MNDVLQAKLAALGDDIRSAALPSDCKQTVVWCFGKLPVLYGSFHQTNESRYGEEITRFVQAMLDELNKGAHVGSQELAVSITERLQLLHQKLGLPSLGLRTPRIAAPPRSHKTRAARSPKIKTKAG